jgi:Domain of unknown function (DUF4340)
MSREKLIISGLVVLGLLGFLVYVQARKDESIGRPTASNAALPTLSAPEGIDKISLTNGDKGEIVLEQVPDPTASTDGGVATKWVMTAPRKAEANQQAVKDVVGNLRDLKADTKINLVLDDATRKDKQLDPAHAVHVVAWKEGEKKVDELFGKSGAAGQLVVLTDKPNDVWAAKGYSSYLYTREPKDFRNKEIFHFDDANAWQVTITNTHGTLVFTKEGDKWTASRDKKPLERFDAEKLKDLLRAYKGLNADDFGDDKSLADTGLDKPEGQVTISVTGESKPLELLVGKVSTGTNHWAKRADADLIYQITSYSSDWVLQDASKFQSAADAGAPDAAAKKTVAAAKK